MITVKKIGNISWIDIESPTLEEIKRISLEHKLHFLVTRELSLPSARSKVDLYGNYIYMVLHFPVLRRQGFGDKIEEEVDFVIGKDFLITVRYKVIEGMYVFQKNFEMENILDKNTKLEHAGLLFFNMVRTLYEITFFQVERLKDSIVDAENKVFLGHEREMVFQLSKISRELMDFDRTLSPHQDILGSFEIAAIKIFGEEYKFFVRTLIGEYQKLARVIKNNSDYLDELKKTNDTLLSTKQNRVIQFLTVVAFIGMPLTIITSLLQIDTVSRPIVGHSNDFWIISGILVTLGLIMYFLFKKKNWL